MDTLINAILKLSREGRRSLHPERIDLASLLQASAQVVGHQLSDADGKVTFDLQVSSLLSDRLSLEQIFGNLFDNAVKYRAKDRPLRIEVRTEPTGDGGCRVQLIDNGRGIAEPDLVRIFDMFTRSGVRDQPGEGIGLAFVQALVRNLGGTIEVRSALGEGTTFMLKFPPLDQSALAPDSSEHGLRQ
jgi:signal transduction histidine kinase